MMNLQIFKNQQFGQIRTVAESGKILFCGSDIARALGYARPNEAVAAHAKGTVKRRTLTNGGEQEMVFITEGDVYRLIVRSKLPSAEQFEHWVFDDVLPSIRKHGIYATPMTIQKNEANNEHYHDGTYWTYNSRKAYKMLFPYMGERQIKSAFATLINNGLVMTGNYNRVAMDRTLWYALTEKGKCIATFGINALGQNVPMEEAKMSQAIPVNTQLCNTVNTNTPPTPPQGEGVEHDEDREDSFDSFWKIYPRKESKQNARKAWDKLKPSPALAEKIIKGVLIYAATPQWTKDGGQFIPHPSTFLNQRRWEQAIEGTVNATAASSNLERLYQQCLEEEGCWGNGGNGDAEE